ncbi:MAG: hypothetical protein BHW65_02415 [Verrucomicrobia bacterium CAG:312_58_20]|nr:MAG: hypothetical protein BHW65_02415 [Verrucomicrobia bacterium CAG:312_58_20]
MEKYFVLIKKIVNALRAKSQTLSAARRRANLSPPQAQTSAMSARILRRLRARAALVLPANLAEPAMPRGSFDYRPQPPRGRRKPPLCKSRKKKARSGMFPSRAPFAKAAIKARA